MRFLLISDKSVYFIIKHLLAFVTDGVCVCVCVFVFTARYNFRLIIIIIFLHGLGRLTCSGIDALPLFPGESTVSSSSRFVVEGVFRESGVVHYFKVVDQVLFIIESHFLYSRDL